MKLSIALTSLLVGSSVALAPSSTSTRRQWMQNIGGAAAAFVVPQLANAGLLDDFGSDPTKISQKETVSATSTSLTKNKPASDMAPNLRSNYYYPTNKKRYLPRIKKCNDALASAAQSIGIEDWEAVTFFAEKVADDTILPLKLYTSSLSGGGTNVKVAYTKVMSKDADVFEKNQKLLLKAITKKNQSLASTALEGMATSLQDYRTVASLTGPDGGGDIPSVDDIRRAACRVQGRRFEETVKARDSRLKQAAGGPVSGSAVADAAPSTTTTNIASKK
jgi:hypothetical protein